MSVTTRKTRTDNKGNIVSSVLMNDNGAYSDEKRTIIYDDNNNIKSVKITTEVLVPGTEEVVQKENLTEYEYTNIDDKYLVSKVTLNGRVQSKHKYESSYIAANGDKEYEAEATFFIYSDNAEIKEPINVIICKSTHIDSENIFISEFDVATITREENNVNVVDDVKHTYGSSDICCYHKNIVWGNVEGEITGSVVEMYWKELEDSTPEKRHFHEFNSYYTVDNEGSMINEDKANMNEFTSDVYMEFGDEGNLTSFYKIVENEAGLQFEFRTDFLETYDNDTIIATMSINKTTDEIITTTCTLKSDGSMIYQEYTKDNIKYHMEKIVEPDRHNIPRVKEVIDQEQNLETKETTIRNETYMYNDDDEIAMITYKYGNEKNPDISHSIYEYDETGHRCKNIITENSITTKFYQDDKEVFSIMNVGYPMCKSVFEFCYNRLLSEM